jgi:hypothetical protein
MKNYKNYLIALLTGLLVLTLTTQPSIGAGKSKEAKLAEYLVCLQGWEKNGVLGLTLDSSIRECSKYRP